LVDGIGTVWLRGDTNIRNNSVKTPLALPSMLVQGLDRPCDVVQTGDQRRQDLLCEDRHLFILDSSQCPDLESIPGKCSGAWCVKGTRVMVQGILDNTEDCSTAKIAEMFELPVDVVRRILRFHSVNL